MRKAAQWILIIAFAMTICISQPLCGFLGSKVSGENRTLAEKPELTMENLKEYIEAFTQYADDNILMRNDLVKLNNYIDYFIFMQAANTNVIIGNDNWLFYANAQDGNCMGEYAGQNLYTEEQLKAIAENCQKQKDILTEMGKEFVIFIAPNKERVYSDYMPAVYGKPAEEYRTNQLVDYLRANTDISVLYAYDELCLVKDEIDENIFFKQDTHWNEIGAYVGASMILKQFGIEMPDVKSLDRIAFDWVWGDLSGMLGLQMELADRDFHYAVNGYDVHNRECVQNDFANVIEYKATGADERKLYVIRDSFSGAMAPVLGSQFNSVWMRNYDSYTFADMEVYNPDIVVLETVERYSFRLETFSVR